MELPGFHKKKVNEELALFFPHRSGEGPKARQYEKLRQKALLQLSDLGGEDEKIQDKIQQIDDYFTRAIKSLKFDGKDGEEVKMVLAYEATCSIISENGYSQNPREISTIQFFKILDLIKEKNKVYEQSNQNKAALSARK